MREIKFRAWDKLHNCWFEKDFFIRANKVYYWNHDRTKLCSTKSLIPLQFVGIKDKNGKEIYEGDVVETNRYLGTPGEFKDMIGIIVFSSCKFIVQDNELGVGFNYELHGSSKIIGNIYENPELMEEQ